MAESTAQGIEVSGYRPRPQDLEEANRRAQQIEPVIASVQKVDASTPNFASASPEHTKPDPKAGIRGEVISQGVAPYSDKKDAKDSPYVELRLEDGRSHRVWGVDLPRAMNDAKVQDGDVVTLAHAGTRQVEIQVKDEKTGKSEQRLVDRREWAATDVERASERNETSDPQKPSPVIETEQKAEREDKKQDRKKADGPAQAPHNTQPNGKEERFGEGISRNASATLAIISAELRAQGVDEGTRHKIIENLTPRIANLENVKEPRLANVAPEHQRTVNPENKLSSPTKMDERQLVTETGERAR